MKKTYPGLEPCPLLLLLLLWVIEETGLTPSLCPAGWHEVYVQCLADAKSKPVEVGGMDNHHVMLEVWTLDHLIVIWHFPSMYLFQL